MLSYKNQLLLKNFEERISKLEAELAEMKQQANEPQQAPKRGPGRPRKDEQAA